MRQINAILMVCCALGASGAAAANLESDQPPLQINVEKVTGAISSLNVKRIGVCPRVIYESAPDGAAESGTQDSFGGSLGPMADYLASAIQRALREAAPSDAQVTDVSAAANGLAFDVGQLSTASGRRQLLAAANCDALVITRAAEGVDDRIRLRTELVNAKGIVSAFDDTRVQQHFLDAAYAGSSFELARFVNRRLRSVTANGTVAQLVSSQPHPLLDEGVTYGIQVIVHGKNGERIERRPIAIQGRLFVEINQGDVFSINCWNHCGHDLQMAIYVDGVNSIGKKSEHPRNTPYERIWQIPDGINSGSISWTLPNQRSANDGSNLFKMTQRASAVAYGQHVDDRFGMLTAVVFTRGPVAKIEETKAVAAALLGVGEGPTDRPPSDYLSGEKGMLIAAMTLHYRTHEEIDDLLGRHNKPNPQPQPQPKPPGHPNETVRVPNDHRQPGENELTRRDPKKVAERHGGEDERVKARLRATAKALNEQRDRVRAAQAHEAKALLIEVGLPGRPVKRVDLFPGFAESGVSGPGADSERSTEEQAPVATGGAVLVSTLQRNSRFLGTGAVKSELQLAFVIDGTESMGKEIESIANNVRGLVDGLRELTAKKSLKVTLAAVVYRDVQAPSGVTSIITDFTPDIDQFKQKIGQVKVETGDPYFEERVDEGISVAIDKLTWSKPTDDVTRWMILCGDAPPYPEQNPARTHSDKELQERLQAKQIEFYGLLVNSGFTNPGLDNDKLKQTALSARPDAQRFLSRLATATNGRYLDFWDKTAMVALLEKKSQRTIVGFTEDEIARTRKDMGLVNAGAAVVTLAVLPHVAANDLTKADGKSPEVQYAMLLTQKLDHVPGIACKSLADVSRALAQVPVDAQRDVMLSKLAARLQADDIIWGVYNVKDGQAKISSTFYRGLDGAEIAEETQVAKVTSNDGMLRQGLVVGQHLLTRAARSLASQGTSPDVIDALSSASRDETVRSDFMSPFADDLRAQRAILAGLVPLQQALEFQKSLPGASTGEQNAPSRKLLQDAITELTSAVAREANNAYAHLLLSSCYFNLAPDSNDFTAGHTPSAELKSYQEHIETAFKNREAPLFANGPIIDEITGQYNLLVKRDAKSAIEAYQRILAKQANSPHKSRIALRAHWMLSGIYLGDWGVAQYSPATIDLKLARDHILAILAAWPDEPEGRFYKTCLAGSSTDKSREVPRHTAQTMANLRP